MLYAQNLAHLIHELALKSGAKVAVIGTIRNKSSVPWQEIRFHAEFLDTQGRCKDVGEREDSRFYDYGVMGNYKMLEMACEHTRAKWEHWLTRRNSKDRMSWKKFAHQVEQVFALPLSRTVHEY